MLLIRACGNGDRTIAMCNMPGSTWSSRQRPCPATSRSSSWRNTEWPMPPMSAVVVGAGWVVVIVAPSTTQRPRRWRMPTVLFFFNDPAPTEIYTLSLHDALPILMPDACIGVDVIVGFPGETDELFLETYHFLNDLDISYLHVFTYSERDNTEAVLMEDVVPANVRAKRSKMLRGLSVKKRRAFYESQLDTQHTVLFESENKEGYIHGFTENYVKVKTPWNPELVNTLHDIHLTKIDEDGLVRFDFLPVAQLQ